MFPSNMIKTGLTLPKVLGGISKTLNVANQVIPLYMQAKPMIQNARKAFTLAKEIMAPPNETKKSPTKKATSTVTLQKKEEYISPTSQNNPVFFL